MQGRRKMKKIIGYASIMILILFLVGCAPAQHQTTTYQENNYCGDGNCDSDEDCNSCYNDCGECPKEYRNFEIKMYIQHSSPGYSYWKEQLPSYPSRQYSNYELSWDPYDESQYDGGWLHIYTFYDEETITCYGKEYYDGRLNEQFTEKLYSQGDGVSGVSLRVAYEKPLAQQVRYDVECVGDESNKKVIDSYKINILPPN